MIQSPLTTHFLCDLELLEAGSNDKIVASFDRVSPRAHYIQQISKLKIAKIQTIYIL